MPLPWNMHDFHLHLFHSYTCDFVSFQIHLHFGKVFSPNKYYWSLTTTSSLSSSVKFVYGAQCRQGFAASNSNMDFEKQSYKLQLLFVPEQRSISIIIYETSGGSRVCHHLTSCFQKLAARFGTFLCRLCILRWETSSIRSFFQSEWSHSLLKEHVVGYRVPRPISRRFNFQLRFIRLPLSHLACNHLKIAQKCLNQIQ